MIDNPRSRLLEEAIQIVCGDRNISYGDPQADFKRTAGIWTAMFGVLLKEDAEFQSHHVAMAMIALKLSRLMWSPDKYDSWLDMAGYSATGWDTVQDLLPKRS